MAAIASNFGPAKSKSLPCSPTWKALTVPIYNDVQPSTQFHMQHLPRRACALLHLQLLFIFFRHKSYTHFALRSESKYRTIEYNNLPFPRNKMTTAAVFGSTGAVGGKILETLLSTDFVSSVKTISRRAPKAESAKLEAVVEADSAKWGGLISSLKPTPSVVFNAVGTTRAAAGGLANQWKIDHDLCIENAKAAKAAGVKTYVYISSAGTRAIPGCFLPYSKMKIGVEDAIKDLGFDQAIILRPAAILGEREAGPKSAFFESLIGNLDKISTALKDKFGKFHPSRCSWDWIM